MGRINTGRRRQLRIEMIVVAAPLLALGLKMVGLKVATTVWIYDSE